MARQYQRKSCDECRRIPDDERWPAYGPDFGASHFFCDPCLEKLEIGQGLCEDPLFMRDCRIHLRDIIREGYDLQDVRAMANRYRILAAMYAAAAGVKNPLHGPK